MASQLLWIVAGFLVFCWYVPRLVHSFIYLFNEHDSNWLEQKKFQLLVYITKSPQENLQDLQGLQCCLQDLVSFYLCPLSLLCRLNRLLLLRGEMATSHSRFTFHRLRYPLRKRASFPKCSNKHPYTKSNWAIWGKYSFLCHLCAWRIDDTTHQGSDYLVAHWAERRGWWE